MCNSNFQTWYREIYLKSNWWKKKSAEIRKRDNYSCQNCGSEGFDVHHKTKEAYKRLWKEKNSDLVTLCRSCHQAADWNLQNPTKMPKSKMQIIEEKLRKYFGNM